MGSIAILAIMATVLTRTFVHRRSLERFPKLHHLADCHSVLYFPGFIETGLGTRIAYLFSKKVRQKKSWALSYSLLASDLLLAPAMPSNTARAGGIIFPISGPFRRPSVPAPETEPEGSRRFPDQGLLSRGSG